MCFGLYDKVVFCDLCQQACLSYGCYFVEIINSGGGVLMNCCNISVCNVQVFCIQEEYWLFKVFECGGKFIRDVIGQDVVVKVGGYNQCF